MRNSILALVSASLCASVGGLAQAQTFPNQVPSPASSVNTVVPSGSGPVSLANDYIVLQHVATFASPIPGAPPISALAADGMLPMSAFAGSADLNTTNANLATVSTNLAATNANLGRLAAFTDQVRKEARQGVASAMAMSTASMPSEPGRTSWTVNGAAFDGQAAWGGSVAHRLNFAVPFAVTAGFAVSYSNSGGRIGLAGEF
jgi:hypothetical protein